MVMPNIPCPAAMSSTFTGFALRQRRSRVAMNSADGIASPAIERANFTQKSSCGLRVVAPIGGAASFANRFG